MSPFKTCVHLFATVIILKMQCKIKNTSIVKSTSNLKKEESVSKTLPSAPRLNRYFRHRDGNLVAEAKDSVEGYIARMSAQDKLYTMVMRFVVSSKDYFGK